MKRRSVCFLLCISMLLMLFPANAYAYGGTLYSESVAANHTDNTFAPVMQGPISWIAI